MDIWVIPLLAAIGGATIALIGKELIEWYKRPRLEIDFEEREGQKPFIPDYNWEGMTAIGHMYRMKHFRLIVRNKGKKPAMDCEAKLSFSGTNDLKTTSNKVALHWSRRDPALYRQDTFFDNKEKVYSPINLNINDEEPIEVLLLPYSFSTKPDTDHDLIPYGNEIKSASFRELVLQPNVTYRGIVTVYSSNTTLKSFKFKINWDGQVDRFNKAITRD